VTRTGEDQQPKKETVAIMTSCLIAIGPAWGVALSWA